MPTMNAVQCSMARGESVPSCCRNSMVRAWPDEEIGVSYDGKVWSGGSMEEYRS